MSEKEKAYGFKWKQSPVQYKIFQKWFDQLDFTDKPKHQYLHKGLELVDYGDIMIARAGMYVVCDLSGQFCVCTGNEFVHRYENIALDLGDRN